MVWISVWASLQTVGCQSLKGRASKGGRKRERGKKACTFAHMKEIESITDDGYIRHCILKSNPQIHPPPFHLSFIYVQFVIFYFPIWWQLCVSDESSKSFNFIFFFGFLVHLWITSWKLFSKAVTWVTCFYFAGITATLCVACLVLKPIFIALWLQQ